MLGDLTTSMIIVQLELISGFDEHGFRDHHHTCPGQLGGRTEGQLSRPVAVGHLSIPSCRRTVVKMGVPSSKLETG
jgi:hypothetical protein